MRQELIDFCHYFETNNGVRIHTNNIETCVDAFLKSRNSDMTLRQSSVGQQKVKKKNCQDCGKEMDILYGNQLFCFTEGCVNCWPF